MRPPHILAAAAVLAAAAALPASASAAGTAFIGINVFPAGLYGTGSSASTTAYGYYYTGVGSVPSKTVFLRGGTVFYDSATSPIQPTLALGDVVRVVQSSDGTVLAEATYDSPVPDATCSLQRAFAGKRAADGKITVNAVRQGGGGNYSGAGANVRIQQVGRITTQGDGTYAGTFDRPLAVGDFLQTKQVSLRAAGDTQVQVNTDVITPTNICGTPGGGGDTAGDTTAPRFTKFTLPKGTVKISDFLKKGITTTPTLSEPGTVTEQLVLDNGAKLPAKAAAKKKKAKKKVVTLGKGKGTTAKAGKFKVVVKKTAKAKRTLKGRKNFRTVLIVTARDAAGNTTTIKRRITLRK